MIRQLRWLVAAIFITLMAGQFASLQALDPRYKDADGDLVADAPEAKDQIDPPGLIFAYTPVEDPAVYQGVGRLSQAPGEDHRQERRVLPGAIERRADRGDALRPAACRRRQRRRQRARGELRGLRAVRDDGGQGRQFGYEMEIIVPAAGIKKPADLKGHKIAFTAQTSNSGFKAPSAILKRHSTSKSARTIEPVFSGKHDNSILGVVNKDYEAAAVANSVLNRMIDRKVFETEQIRSIYKSQTFPTTGYGYVYNLDPKLVEKIKEASSPSRGRARRCNGIQEGRPRKFIPIDYKKDWAVLRKIDEATGVKYTCK